MAWNTYHVYCGFILLIVFTHSRLHKYLITYESVTSCTYLTCLPFSMIFGKNIVIFVTISISTSY